MIGQIVLILYSFVSILLIPADTLFVVAFLMTVIYVSWWDLCPAQRRTISWAWLVLCILFPPLTAFSPAVLYSMLEDERYVPASFLIFLCIFVWMGKGNAYLILQIAGCVFSAVLSYQSRIYGKLLDKYQKTRDDSTEWNMILKEKNQNLLKNQDYEIYAATLKERNRIAREIHDHVGHMLSRAILMVGAMKAVNQQETLSEPLSQLEETLNTAMTNVRESVHDLHDDSVNMGEVLRGIIEEYHFCPVQFTYDVGNYVPREVKYSFIAIVKEGLNNIAKHSGAKKAEITVREHPGLYQLVIKDNGSNQISNGITEELARNNVTDKGIGIRNMRERTENLGGNFQISCEKGFCIYITVPKKGEG